MLLLPIVCLFVLVGVFALGYFKGVEAGKAEANGKYKDKIVVKTKEVVDSDD